MAGSPNPFTPASKSALRRKESPPCGSVRQAEVLGVTKPDATTLPVPVSFFIGAKRSGASKKLDGSEELDASHRHIVI